MYEFLSPDAKKKLFIFMINFLEVEICGGALLNLYILKLCSGGF
jgi:hypothetical protein